MGYPVFPHDNQFISCHTPPVIVIRVGYVLEVVCLLGVGVEVAVLEKVVGRVVGAGHLVLLRQEVRAVQGALSESAVGRAQLSVGPVLGPVLPVKSYILP